MSVVIFPLRDKRGKIEEVFTSKKFDIISSKIIEEQGRNINIFVVRDNSFKKYEKSKLVDVDKSLDEVLEEAKIFYFLILEEVYGELQKIVDILLFEAKLIFEFFPYKSFIENFFKNKLGISIALKRDLSKNPDKELKIIKVSINKSSISLKISSIISSDNNGIYKKTRHIYEDIFVQNGEFLREVNYQYINTLLTLKFIEKYEKEIAKVNSVYIKLFSHVYSLYPAHSLYEKTEEENLLEYLKDIISFLNEFSKYRRDIAELPSNLLNDYITDEEVIRETIKFIEYSITTYELYLSILENFKNIIDKQYSITFKDDNIQLKIKFITNINYKWIIISNFLTFPQVYLCSAFPLVLFNPIALLSISFEFNWYSMIKDQFKMLSIDTKERELTQINIPGGKIIRKIKEKFPFKVNIVTCHQVINFKRDSFKREYEILKKKKFYLSTSIKESIITVNLCKNSLRHLLITAHGPLHIHFIPKDKLVIMSNIKESILMNAYIYFAVMNELEKYFKYFLENDTKKIEEELRCIEIKLRNEGGIEEDKISELFDHNRYLCLKLKDHINKCFEMIAFTKTFLEVETGNLESFKLLTDFINNWLFEMLAMNIF